MSVSAISTPAASPCVSIAGSGSGCSIAATIGLMVVVGGLTRLTGSGFPSPNGSP
jgi:hypothetical protein